MIDYQKVLEMKWLQTKSTINELASRLIVSPYKVTSNSLYKQQGFTLIEVMIALAISTVALLGLAAGQLKSLQYATNSFNYTVSLVQANNAVERTWVNLCGLQDGSVSYDDAYYNANFQPQITAYSLTPVPAIGAAFNDDLTITVDWTDARMANPDDSRIRTFAQYPDIC